MRRSLFVTFSLFAFTAMAWQLRRALTAKPRYAVQRRSGPLEIRLYRPRVVAHTEVDREFVRALHEGFERLGHFAHGDNETKTHVVPSEPYTATPATDGELTGGYVIAMEMPERHEPPRPTDTRVKIDTVPARRVAALCFRGAVGTARVRRMTDRLLAFVKNEGLTTAGETSFATYDPPSVLPVMRRNEIWVELA